MSEDERQQPEHAPTGQAAGSLGARGGDPKHAPAGQAAGSPGAGGGDRDERLDRRALLRRGLLAGGALAGGGAVVSALISGPDEVDARRARPRVHRPGGRKAPNVLVVMVDQLRTPMWFSAASMTAAAMPNLAALREGAVSFAGHYTAANDCTPARAALLTGLHTHQTGCMITGGSTLDPGFPTWGTLLRELGYETRWYGKWHLTHGDNLWEVGEDAGALEPYGFGGGTYPSPDGAPGQGWRVDPHIATQFERWLDRAPRTRPWCATVSFVNPHDIAWWYRWSERLAAESQPPSVVGELPPNFETPEQMVASNKPAVQRSLQETAALSFGAVPYSGAGMREAWLPFMDLYLQLLGEVDTHIGTVLGALAARSHVAADTVVVFTSDHGEYGASHGMRGKGASAYEEAIAVPLIVRDPRGKLTAAPQRARTGLTSSVDVVPMLLDIATGDSAWRRDSHYAHLAHRHDITAMLRDPSAPGRRWVLHATDEIVTEFAAQPYAASAPLHVVALRTPRAKYAVYSNFAPHTIDPVASGREAELYDYGSAQGLMELNNEAGSSALEPGLAGQLKGAVRHELRAPLPARLRAAQRRGMADYFKTARRAAVKAAARRRQRAEEEASAPVGAGPPGAEGETGPSGVPTLSARRRAGRRGPRRRRGR